MKVEMTEKEMELELRYAERHSKLLGIAYVKNDLGGPMKKLISRNGKLKFIDLLDKALDNLHCMTQRLIECRCEGKFRMLDAAIIRTEAEEAVTNLYAYKAKTINYANEGPKPRTEATRKAKTIVRDLKDILEASEQWALVASDEILLRTTLEKAIHYLSKPPSALKATKHKV